MEFTGELEIHFTLSLPEACNLADLQSWGTDHGFKLLHIVLERGVNPSQVMLTQQQTGGLTSVLTHARAIASQVSQTTHYAVTRIKIEASAEHPDVPQSATEAQACGSDRYFEHHLKLLLPPDTDLTRLKQVAVAQGAHLSRNALSLRANGDRDQFVTQRCFGLGRSQAQEQLKQLRTAIAAQGYPILDVEAEFVIYDSNLVLDAGWLDPYVRFAWRKSSQHVSRAKHVGSRRSHT
jgi:hypothetical protein